MQGAFWGMAAMIGVRAGRLAVAAFPALVALTSFPLFVPSVARAADTVFDWSTRPVTDLETTTDTGTVDGISVTTSGSIVGARTSDTIAINPGTTTNGYTGIITSELDANIDNESVYNEIVFGFSEPVYNLRFRTIDVDGYNVNPTRFSDLMVYSSSAGVPSSATVGSSVTYTAATGRARENATANCGGDDPNCQVNVVFIGPVTSATIRHVAADAAGGTNPTNQAIQIFDLTFNTPPDAANNVNATFPGGSAVGNVITDDDGSGLDSDRQDGASLLVNQISHPTGGTSAVGAGGVTITLANGAQLTIGQDGGYTFNTNGAYGALASGASTSETFTYRVEDLEGLFNTNGDTPNPDSVATLIITITNNPVPSYIFSKTVSQPSISSPGTLTYTITADNTGNVDLSGVTLSDTLTIGSTLLTMTSGPTLQAGSDADSDGALDISETWVWNATYAVTASDINTGNTITNSAVLTTNEAGSLSSTASTTTPGPTISCAGNAFASPNIISGAIGTTVCSTTGATGETGEFNLTGGALETIWYRWTAPANGTVTFDTCSAVDTLFDTTLVSFSGGFGAGNVIASNDDTVGCATSTNAGRASTISFPVTAGSQYNIQVDGYGNEDGQFRLNWNMSYPLATISKAASPTSVTAVGQIVTYTIVVDNAGTVDLTAPVLSDIVTQSGLPQALVSGPTLISGDADLDGVLDTIETWVYTAGFSVSEANFDNGANLLNTASFSSAQTTAVAATANTGIVQIAALGITKTANFITGTAPAGTGDVIRYTYEVTNTGNVTITDVNVSDVHDGLGTFDTTPAHEAALITDAGTTGNSPDSNISPDIWGTLASGDVIRFTADYAVVQQDVDGQQ